METGLVSAGTTVPKKNEIQLVDVDSGELSFPDLSRAAVVPISLNHTYWTPEKAGEAKRVVFLEIRPERMHSVDGDGEVLLDCAIFLEQTGDGTIQQIGNGSKVLVGSLLAGVDSGIVKRGMPFLVTFLGKAKNKTNQFFSDRWSIKPLLINID